MRRRPSFGLFVWLVALATPAATLVAADAQAAPARRAVSAQGKKAARQSHTKRRHGKRQIARERAVPWMKNNLPNVLAYSALVVDLDTGEELYSRRADGERPIASISKLAAALVVVERGLDLDGLTTITRADAEVAKGGAPSRLLEGMTVSNRDLLHAALLGSDNRAVAAMGRAVGLPSSALAAEMTKRVAALGLKHTRFREPTGLSPENVSTPRETITMLRAAMANPVLAPVLRRMEYDAHPVSRPAVHYTSTYKPAVRSNADVLGGKTGYNDFARYCLVVAAKVDGRRVGMAFLGTEGKLTRFGDFARVADWIVVRKPKGAATTAVASASGPAVTPAAIVPAKEQVPAHGPAATGEPGLVPASATQPPPTVPAPVATEPAGG